MFGQWYTHHRFGCPQNCRPRQGNTWGHRTCKGGRIWVCGVLQASWTAVFKAVIWSYPEHSFQGERPVLVICRFLWQLPFEYALWNIEEKGYQNYLDSLSSKYNKNKGQILLRFHIQRGIIPIPKSTNPKRLALNLSVFDFSLTTDEMATLSGFNKNKQYLPESKGCPGF